MRDYIITLAKKDELSEVINDYNREEGSILVFKNGNRFRISQAFANEIIEILY